MELNIVVMVQVQITILAAVQCTAGGEDKGNTSWKFCKRNSNMKEIRSESIRTELIEIQFLFPLYFFWYF